MINRNNCFFNEKQKITLYKNMISAQGGDFYSTIFCANFFNRNGNKDIAIEYYKKAKAMLPEHDRESKNNINKEIDSIKDSKFNLKK